jgi:hypothetical protein
MNRSTRAFGRVAIAASAAALALAGPANATTANVKVPFDGLPAGNVCNGEELTLYGNAHLVQHGDFVEGDTQHVSFHLNMQGVRAIGSFGNEYRFVQSQQSIQQSTAGAANEMTLEETMNVVSKGGEVNFAIHETLHTTINANGEVTADPFSFHVNCNG